MGRVDTAPRWCFLRAPCAGFCKNRDIWMEDNTFLGCDACQTYGKHLTYALVQDIQKGGAASSHHPHLIHVPPGSLQQCAGSVGSSFPPIYDEETASELLHSPANALPIFLSSLAACSESKALRRMWWPGWDHICPAGDRATQQHPRGDGWSGAPKAWPG